MKRFFLKLSPVKRRVGAAIVIGALLLTAGAFSAFAADSDSPATGGTPADENLLVRVNDGSARYSTDGGDTWADGLPEGGATHFSTDGGQTWNDGLPPEGAEGDGPTLVVNGTAPNGGMPPMADGAAAPGEGFGGSLMVRDENGDTRYSTDGGQTWTDTPPAGVTVDEDGRVTMQGAAAA